LGFDLLTRRPTYAPLNCVVSPYTAFSGMPLFYSSTNGLASGNTRVDALCHALCEVVERDASALAMASSHVRPAVAAILSDIGFGGGIIPGWATNGSGDRSPASRDKLGDEVDSRHGRTNHFS
jgi:hypothetical protein